MNTAAKKPTAAQEHLIVLLKRGYILICNHNEGYHEFDTNHAWLRNPNMTHDKAVLVSTISAMLKKCLIEEKKRYIASYSTQPGREGKTWNIEYKLVEHDKEDTQCA